VANRFDVVAVGHGLLYIGDQASARSLTYLVAFLVNVAILVLPAFS
jgi:uncharacterized MAPEG superfamily protein